MRFRFSREAEETDRMLALSDGVIAIVITLLVLDITVPTVPRDSPPTVLIGEIFGQWPEFVGFVLSFLVVGHYWVLHRRTFIYIQKHERGLVYLNLLFLLMTAFIPYATGMFTAYPNQFGISFLSVVLALTGLSLALVWIYAARTEIVDEGLASRVIEIQAARFLVSPMVFLVSIIAAVFDPRLAILTWLLLFPLNGLMQSRLVETLEES